MQSQLINHGNRMVLEITLPTTGIDRDQAAREALQAHYLTEGMVQVVFVNPSTSEVRE